MEQLNFDGLKNLQSAIANLSGQVFQYHKHWGSAFCVKEILEHTRRFAEKYSTNLELTKEELESLGFKPWEEGGPYLMPVWIFPFVADGTRLTSISGEECVVGEDNIDNDIRMGCLAYGVTPLSSPQPTVESPPN